MFHVPKFIISANTLCCLGSDTKIGCRCESRRWTPQVEKYRIRKYGFKFEHRYRNTECYNIYNIFVLIIIATIQHHIEAMSCGIAIYNTILHWGSHLL